MLFQFQKTLNIILVSITKLVTLKFRKIFSYLDTSYTAAQSVFLCFSSQSCETWGHMLGCRWMSMLMERKGIFSRWQSNFFLSYMVSRDLFQWSVYFSCVFVGWGLIFFFSLFMCCNHKFHSRLLKSSTLTLYLHFFKELLKLVQILFFQSTLHNKIIVSWDR